MARIYNPEQYGNQFQSSAQSRGFVAETAIDRSAQEREKARQTVANLQVEEQALKRQQTIERGQMNLERQALTLGNQVERANLDARNKTFEGILKLSSTAMETYTFFDNERREQEEIDQAFKGYEGYKLGAPEVAEGKSAEAGNDDFNTRRAAEGLASVEVASNPAEQSDLNAGVEKVTRRVNQGRKSAYQAAQGYGIYMEDFLTSNRVITRPDGSTFTPATAENQADLAAAISLGRSSYAAEVGVKNMDRDAVKNTLLRTMAGVDNSQLNNRGQKIRARREEIAVEDTTSTLREGLDANSNTSELYQNAFSSLVGVGGRDNRQASQDAFALVVQQAKAIGKTDADKGIRILEALEATNKIKGNAGTRLGKGITGDAIAAAKADIRAAEYNTNSNHKKYDSAKVEDLSNQHTRALLDAKTPEEIEAAHASYESQLSLMAPNSQAAFEELQLQRRVQDSYSPKYYEELQAQIAAGDLVDKAELKTMLQRGEINAQEYNSIVGMGGAVTTDWAVETYGSREQKKASDSQAEGRVVSFLNSNAGLKTLPTDIQKNILGRVSNDVVQRKDLAVREYINKFPEATPGDVAQFEQGWLGTALPELLGPIEIDKETGAVSNYEYLGSTSVKSNSAGQVLNVRTYSNAYTRNEAQDLSGLTDVQLDSIKRRGLVNIVDDKVLTTDERNAAIKSYLDGTSYSPSVEAKARAMGVSAHELVKGQAKGSGLKITGAPGSQKPAGNSDISTVEQEALNVIGKYESDAVGGYNAVNQYGGAGGHSTGADQGFYSGDFRQMSQHSGRDLTSLSVSEIMNLQAEAPISNSEWRDQGKLHAVGRYQFIRGTFANVVRAMGISGSTKFTPALQDQMALWLLRNSANGIAQWVGPNSYATPAERSVVNKARQRLVSTNRILRNPNRTDAQTRRAQMDISTAGGMFA